MGSWACCSSPGDEWIDCICVVDHGIVDNRPAGKNDPPHRTMAGHQASEYIRKEENIVQRRRNSSEQRLLHVLRVLVAHLPSPLPSPPERRYQSGVLSARHNITDFSLERGVSAVYENCAISASQAKPLVEQLPPGSVLRIHRMVQMLLTFALLHLGGRRCNVDDSVFALPCARQLKSKTDANCPCSNTICRLLIQERLSGVPGAPGAYSG